MDGAGLVIVGLRRRHWALGIRHWERHQKGIRDQALGIGEDEEHRGKRPKRKRGLVQRTAGGGLSEGKQGGWPNGVAGKERKSGTEMR